MNNTQFDAEAGRRAELRKASDKAANYLEATYFDKGYFDFWVDDKARANVLFAILLREVIDLHPDGDEYLTINSSPFKKLEIPPEAILIALKDLKKFRTKRAKHCSECGALKEQKAA